LLRLPGCFPLRPQAGQRRTDPLIPACRATISLASWASLASVRLAALDAPAAIFIPSSATTPSFPMPSRAHRPSTSAKNPAIAAPKQPRNRAMVA